MQNELTYQTSSLGLSAFLVSKDHKFLRTQHIAPKSLFVFARTPELLKDVNDFESLSAVVQPQKFHWALRLLRESLNTGRGEKA